MFDKTLNLQHLRQFVELVRIGNFGRAAARLGIDQSQLTHVISKLETLAGFPLLVREPKGISLTPTGARLEDFGASLLAQIEGFNKSFSKPEQSFAPDRRDEVRLGVSASIAPAVVGPLISTFSLLTELRTFSIHEDDDATLCEKASRGELDAVITCTLPRSKDLISFLIVSQPLVYVMPARWSGWDLSARQSLKDISERPLVLLGERNGIRRLLTKEASRFKLQFASIVQSDSVATLKELVASGVGGTVAPQKVFEREVRSGRFELASIIEPKLVCGVHLSLSNFVSQDVSTVIHRNITPLVISSLQPA